MSTSLVPTSVLELSGIIDDARAHRTPIRVLGSGSKDSIGRPVQAALDLSTNQLKDIEFYEPKELVLCAQAGTSVAEVEALLAQSGQRLAFEIPDYRSLLNTSDTEPTLGGVVATNLSGPRRISVGAARDHLLGVKGVTGRGELIQSGGRVMKNVTGYDLCKVLVGSYGTLAVLSQVTFKVLPQPETEVTLVWRDLNDGQAQKLMSQALGTPFEVTGAAHLPSDVSLKYNIPESLRGAAVTLVRLEGFADSLSYRQTSLSQTLAKFGESFLLLDTDSRGLWQTVKNVLPFAGNLRPVWRISTIPTRGPSLVATLRSKLSITAFYDWGGGLVWVQVESDDSAAQEASTAVIQNATVEFGGNATLIRASQSLRSKVNVFQRLDHQVMNLNQRIRSAFDPDKILNPGRMYPEV